MISIERHLHVCFGSVTFSPLYGMSDEDAELFLNRLSGVGVKTASAS
jgi:3-methyladenine DNA glycosylase/8-oxoguanine DNA glycosylase